MSLNSSVNDTSPPAVPLSAVLPYSIPTAICLLTVLVCLVGLVGNGITIYLFIFRIRLNQSTVYILNLAVADFIYVLCCCMVSLYFLCMFNKVPTTNQSDAVFGKFGDFLHTFGFNSSLFFLAALSIERSLSVRFPIWYKCYRPEHLSAILCGIIWIMSVLITVIQKNLFPEHSSTIYIVVSVLFLVVTLAMIGATVVLLIEIQKTSLEFCPLKLYIVVVTSVITFLISLLPATIIRLLFFFAFIPTTKMKLLSFLMISLCSAINSAVNPYIYIVVGRWRKRVSTTQALESVFKEEDGGSSKENDSAEMQYSETEH
ncbi:hypothetical protein PRIEUP_LOCUS1355, partial [Pristimantis euphronides]